MISTAGWWAVFCSSSRDKEHRRLTPPPLTQKTPAEVSPVARLQADQRTRRLTPKEIEGLRQRGHEQSAVIRAELDRRAQEEAERLSELQVEAMADTGKA